MTDQETEAVIEGDVHDQDQGQGVLTGIAETLAVGEIDSEGETGQTHIHHALYIACCLHLTRPRCGLNRALNLTVTHTVQLRFYYCFYLYANVKLVKRDIVTTVIYCYITTDFYYVKRDSRLSAYGGVMLQRVGIEKNINRHFSLNF